MLERFHVAGAALLLCWASESVGQDLDVDVPPVSRVPAPTRAADCDMPMSFSDMRQCAEHPYPKAHFELEAAWSAAMARANREDLAASDDGGHATRAIDLLAEAQGEWLRVRDARCAAMAAERSGPERAGTWSWCMADLTRARAAQLRAYASGSAPAR
jgi:uncharacterized protein YecT (DUF1311 family)